MRVLTGCDAGQRPAWPQRQQVRHVLWRTRIAGALNTVRIGDIPRNFKEYIVDRHSRYVHNTHNTCRFGGMCEIGNNLFISVFKRTCNPYAQINPLFGSELCWKSANGCVRAGRAEAQIRPQHLGGRS